MNAKIYSNDFNRIVAATKNFVAQSDIKKLHRYIKLEFNKSDSRVTAIAVDGYRLSVEHAVCECDEDFVAYMDAKVHLPSGIDAFIEVSNGEAIIRCGDFICGCAQRDGEFLDWRKSLPEGEPAFRIGVNGNYLLSALQAAKISCGKSFKNTVVLEFRTEISPIILRTNEDDVKLVMPVRINNHRKAIMKEGNL